MTSIDPRAGIDSPTPGNSPGNKRPPFWQIRPHGHHWKSIDDEFEASKFGMWLFLTTEVLLFAGLFCAYAVLRMMYPDAFRAGSGLLDWRWGLLNTVILLISSFTVAMSVRCAQLNQQRWLIYNLVITLVCAAAFLFIKVYFEYIPKWTDGKRPGSLFSYPFAADPHEHLWWSVYYCSTAVHALHVVIGACLLTWVLVRAATIKAYGPREYTMVETSALYWHLVDLVWIFLFPLLYLIH